MKTSLPWVGGGVAAAFTILVFVLLTAGPSCSKPAVQLPPPPPPPILIPPLHDAQAGEQLVLSNGVIDQIYRVVSASDGEVEVEITTRRDDMPVEERAPYKVTLNRNSWGIKADHNGAPTVNRRFVRDTLDAGGKTFPCWRVDVFSRKGNFVYWLTDALPVHGIVKIARVVKNRIEDEQAFVYKRHTFPPK